MTLALKAATRTIPIVTIVGDPLLKGIAANLRALTATSLGSP